MTRTGSSLVTILVLLVAAVALTPVASIRASAPDNATSPLGTNLPPLTSWSSEYTFVDAFKQSRPWLTQTTGVWDTDEYDQLELDENGWVKSLPADDAAVSYRWVATVLFEGIGGHYPAGQYTVLYDGEGKIEYSHDATKITALSEPGKDILEVQPGKTVAGIVLKIVETDPNNSGDYIRNIRVLMPGFDEHNAPYTVFHPQFIESASAFKVIRFMDWMRTNWNADGPIRATRTPQAEWQHPLHEAPYNPYLVQPGLSRIDTTTAELLAWENRPQATDARYATDDGVPLEIMIALANEISADPWFNLPHHASDEYIYNFAATVRDELAANRYVYVEYSNEVWNNGFYQAQWVEQQAMAEWPAATGADGQPVQPWEKRWNWYGKRTAEMCDIWEDVFGAQSDRVICVIATQATNTWIGEKTLDCPLYAQAPCYAHNVDAVAIAPYFGQHVGQEAYLSDVLAWTEEPDGGLDRLFSELSTGSELPNRQWITKVPLTVAKENMWAYADVANARSLDLVAYEGGQHLVGVGSVMANTTITELFTAANRDPRMSALYEQYFAHWHALGAHINTHYASTGLFSQWGSWGAREFHDDLDAPKRSAIDVHIDTTECNWDTCEAPVISEPTAVTLAGHGAATPSAAKRIALVGFILLALLNVCVIRLRRLPLAT